MVYQRKLVSQLIQRLQEPRRFIQIVVGPRQTGKTTAVNQALENIPDNSHFVSADDPGFISQSWLRNEWEHARIMCRRDKAEIVFVVDEIQKIPQWPSVVKQMWDEDTRHKTRLKVILTGSSSLLLQKGMYESLMGRFEELYSTHWSFQECSDAFGYTFEEFLYFGGYPGSQNWRDDIQRWRRYMSTSIIEPTISQDVLQMEEIRKPTLLRSLFYLGATYSGQELSYVKLLGQLQDAGNTVTLAHYLELLGHAGMLCGLEKFSYEKVRQRKSSPRFMVYDTSLMILAADVLPVQAAEDSIFRGHLIESAIGAYLLARSKEEGFKVFYWRDRNNEVDFVLQKGAAITALEVKSGRIKGTGGSLEFAKQYPQAFFFIVGSDQCPIEDFMLGRVELFKETARTFDLTPVTPAEIISAFWEYINERANAGVLLAQVISDVSYTGRLVRITFDPESKGISTSLLLSLSPFSNLAEFVGIPIAFDDSVGRRLRPEIDGVETQLADGTSLGVLSTAEIYRMSTGEGL
ncbi:MAG: ATP-binding protein [Coriobacteriales bacterium]|jgi:predicted AAA+ superfamily ATPase|nr:ATP-binding protein [Coriobacteriales bacterium]